MDSVIPVDISKARSNLSRLVRNVYSSAKSYEILLDGLPMAKLVPVKELYTPEERRKRFLSAAGSWKMSDKETNKFIKDIYRLRKDGSSKKKYLWMP